MWMGSKVRRDWRHLISQVVMIGLVFQAVMAAYMLPMPAMALEGALESALESGQIVICTPTGLKQITLDDNGNLVETDLPGKHNCPVCDALAGMTLAFQITQPELPTGFVSPENDQPVNDHCPPSIACRAHNNRDPPILV
jgi:hypothetical protein